MFKFVVFILVVALGKVSGNVVPLPLAQIDIPDTLADASEVASMLPNFHPTFELVQGGFLNLSATPYVSSPSPTEPIAVAPLTTVPAISPLTTAAQATEPTSTVATPPAVHTTADTVPIAAPAAPEVAETILSVHSSVLPPVHMVPVSEKPIMDIIQKSLTRLRHAGDRLKKFIEKIETGIHNGAVSQTIENVKEKLASGKVDLHQLITSYKHQSTMNFEDLIKRISDDTHILLDKLHGRVDSFGAYNKNIPHDASDESAEDHHDTLHHLDHLATTSTTSTTNTTI